jgi:hypothetical protein
MALARWRRPAADALDAPVTGQHIAVLDQLIRKNHGPEKDLIH